MATRSKACEDCGHDYDFMQQRCPHCGRPSRFPNVELAELDEEREALDERYAVAVEGAERCGCTAVVSELEAWCSRTYAVTARWLGETHRLASGDHNVYATYYQQTEAEMRLPEGSAWDRLRKQADEALFDGYKREIRFAALSPDGFGLPNYGDTMWVFREEMIAHRASVFEENSALFLKRRKLGLDEDPPAGYRETWAGRGRLCVAKLAGAVDATSTEKDFAQHLLRKGATGEEDQFVEVHIGGPVTIRTLERIIFRKGEPSGPDREYLLGQLAKYDVKLEERAWTS